MENIDSIPMKVQFLLKLMEEFFFSLSSYSYYEREATVSKGRRRCRQENQLNNKLIDLIKFVSIQFDLTIAHEIIDVMQFLCLCWMEN